jgi:hypothetical protein
MKKLLIATAAIGTLSAGALLHAFMPSGSYLVTPGQVVTCTVTCEGVVEVFAFDLDGDGLPDQVPSSGSGRATFTCISTTRTPVPSATFDASSMTLTGNNPAAGNFSFSFDPSRPAPNTTIIANQSGSIFPASVDVYANVIGTVSSLPGTYINRSAACHMQATINTFDPQMGEQYHFVNAVEFVQYTGDADADAAAPTAFTIPANSNVTMN